MRVKTQATDFEKIRAKHVSYKELHIQMIQRTTNQYKDKKPSFKSGQKTNKHLTKEDIQIANKPLKECPIPQTA